MTVPANLIDRRDIAAPCRRADVLTAGMGLAEFMKAAMVRPGAVVVDGGVNRATDAAARTGLRVVGGVACAEVRPVASRITPSPGGVGPLTTATLMHNTVRAAKLAVR